VWEGCGKSDLRIEVVEKTARDLKCLGLKNFLS